jgi:TetR/AcrR family transcriptional regulator, transcriptional repressor for nem operon
MPYRPQHAKQTRSRILGAAQDLLQRNGFEKITIRDVMKEAGLTHGSFYRYFRTKGELYVEVVRMSFDFANARGPRVVYAYLSQRHLGNVGRQCPLISLPSDVARSDPAVKTAFEEVFEAMTHCFERDLARGRQRRSRALLIAGMCIGAMTVSRSLADPALAVELREATLRHAMHLAGWKSRPADREPIGASPSPRRRRALAKAAQTRMARGGL